MQITVIKVSPPETVAAKGKGNGYKKLTVLYKDSANKPQEKVLVSFKNPGVFKTMSNAQEGEVYDVTSVKDGDYWQWTDAELANDTEAPPNRAAPRAEGSGSSDPATSKWKPTNTYETPEERAARQVWIVRQSNISAAIAMGAKRLDEVTSIASALEDYVFDGKTPEIANEVAERVATKRRRASPVEAPNVSVVE